MGDGDRPVFEQFGDDRAAAGTGDDGAVVGVGFFERFGRRRLAVARGEDARDDGAEAGAGSKQGLVDTVEIGEALIGQDQLFVAIEQAQALRHMAEGGVEIARHRQDAFAVDLARGDVLADVCQADQGAGIVAHRRDRHVRPEAFLVFAAGEIFGGEAAVADRRFDAVGVAGDGFQRQAQHFDEAVAHHLVGRIAHQLFGAAVPVGNAAFGVEHEDGVVRDAFQQGAEAAVRRAVGLVKAAAPVDCGRAQDQHPDRNGGQDDRQVGWRHGHAFGVTQGVGNDGDGTHGDEVVRNDGQQQQDGGDGAGPAAAHVQRLHGQGAENEARKNGGADQIFGPVDVARHVDGHHAHIVHDADTGADDGATDPGRAFEGARGGDFRAAAGNGHDADQRHDGQADIEGDRQAGLESHHGDEMGGEDAETARDARGNDPAQALRAAHHARPGQHEHGDRTGHQTHAGRQQDQCPVVVVFQAEKGTKHGQSGAGVGTRSIARRSRLTPTLFLCR